MPWIRILEEAAEEITEAAAWYESERPGLGGEFAQAIEAALDLLQEEIVPLTNLSGQAGRKGAKRLVLRRFPYNVVVQLRSNEIIIVAVAHHSRRPAYWKGRLGT